MKEVYCAIRKKWVKGLPEELVRQNLIAQMVHSLHYPIPLLSIEYPLEQLPHLASSALAIPDRRPDLICFAKNIHPDHALYPLLLVECKAVPLTSKVLQQVAGYNYFVQAYFIAIVNETEKKTGWYDPATQGYMFVDRLLSYPELLQSVTIPCP